MPSVSCPGTRCLCSHGGCCFEQEYWGADLRNVTVLFVNLGLREHDLLAAAAYDDAMKRCHDVLLAVQVRGCSHTSIMRMAEF
jgi:hypothetical protein